MTIFVSDTFTEASDTSLELHTGEIGATWTVHISDALGEFTIDAASDAVYSEYISTSVMYASGTPSGANYTIEYDMKNISTQGNNGVAARIDTASNTMYFVRYNHAGNVWQLYELISGSATELDWSSHELTIDQTYACRFICTDAAKELWVDDVLRCSDATNDITAAGKVGLRGATDMISSTGLHIDNFVATDESTGGILLPASNHIVRLMNQ